MPYFDNHLNSNSFHLSDIIGVCPEDDTRCMGFAKTQGRRCLLPASNIGGRAQASRMLNAGTHRLRSGEQNIDDILGELAPLLLCSRWHSKDYQQTADLVRKWSNQVEKFNQRRSAAAAATTYYPSPPSTPSSASSRSQHYRAIGSAPHANRAPSISSTASGYSSARPSTRSSYSDTSTNWHYSDASPRSSRIPSAPPLFGAIHQQPSSSSSASSSSSRSNHHGTTTGSRRPSGPESTSSRNRPSRGSSASVSSDSYGQYPESVPATPGSNRNTTAEERLDRMLRILENMTESQLRNIELSIPPAEGTRRSGSSSTVRAQSGGNQAIYNPNHQVIVNMPEWPRPRTRSTTTTTSTTTQPGSGHNQRGNPLSQSATTGNNTATQSNTSRRATAQAPVQPRPAAQPSRPASDTSSRTSSRRPRQAPVIRKPIEGECHICYMSLLGDDDDTESEEESDESNTDDESDKEEDEWSDDQGQEEESWEDAEEEWQEEDDEEEEDEEEDGDGDEEEEEEDGEEYDEDEYQSDSSRSHHHEQPELVWCQNQCGHNFHKSCIDSWVASRVDNHQVATCPMCRAPWTSQ